VRRGGRIAQDRRARRLLPPVDRKNDDLFARCAKIERVRKTLEDPRVVPRTSAGPQAPHVRLGAGKQQRASPEAQKPSPHFRPRNCGARVGQVLGPSTIDFCPLFFGERELALTLGVGKALPKSHRKFSPIAGRKFQELRKRAGFHAAIVSREVSFRNWFGPGRTGVTTERACPRQDLLTRFGCWFSGPTAAHHPRPLCVSGRRPSAASRVDRSLTTIAPHGTPRRDNR